MAFGSRFATSGKSEDDDRKFFFGRAKLIDLLGGRLAKHSFLAVLGPSGSDKSSLVLAGLIPALGQGHLGLRWSMIKPGRDPLHELDLALSSLATIRTPSTAAGDNRQTPASETGNPQSAIRNPCWSSINSRSFSP